MRKEEFERDPKDLCTKSRSGRSHRSSMGACTRRAEKLQLGWLEPPLGKKDFSVVVSWSVLEVIQPRPFSEIIGNPL